MKKLLLKIFLIGISIVFVLIIYGAWKIEAKANFADTWKVEKVILNSIDITQDFNTKSISLQPDGRSLLPRHKDYSHISPMIYSNWTYKREALFNGKITISDVTQNIFSGVYDIEILEYWEPQLIVLTSEKCQLYLRGYESFSIENPTIEFDWD